MKKKRRHANKTVSNRILNKSVAEHKAVDAAEGAACGVGRRRRFTVISIACVCVVLAVILTVGFAFSWFAPASNADVNVYVTDFSTKTMFSISDGEYKALEDTDKVTVGTESTLKLRIDYKGRCSAYIRVQLFETFKNSNGSLYPATTVNYTLAPGWVEKDGYYYYTEPVKPKGLEDTEISVPFVTAASTDYNTTDDNGVYFNLVALVEEVQPDRFNEFFGFEPENLTTVS